MHLILSIETQIRFLLQTTLVKMARQKNDGRGRLGGRRKGTPNKVNATIREAIAEQWRNYQQSGQFESDLKELDPQSRAIIMEKYASYITPKMKSVDIEATHDVRMTIEERIRDLSEKES